MPLLLQEDEIESFDQFKPRRLPNHSIVQKLTEREIGLAMSKPNTHLHCAKSFNLNIFPNFTVVNVEKPPCFLRKFAPDGRHFVAFSRDQSSLEIYEFLGPDAAEDLLRSREDLRENEEIIRDTLFDRFFRKKATVTVTSNGEHLNRECSLFTDNGRHVIVGSANTVPDEPPPHFYDKYKNNESVSPNQRSPLEDYTIHIVDLYSCEQVDTRSFKCDKIFLSHNQGLYLYRSLLAILSVQHQTIHIFQVTPDGHFVDVRTVGRFCHEDDQMVFESIREVRTLRPYREVTLNSLKHRILVYLYRLSANEEKKEPLRRFFQHFDQFRLLRMWKMQLLDEDHLLIKYACEDVVTLKVTDPNSQLSIFVVYNMATTQVVAVFENNSETLLELFEQFSDTFRNALPGNYAQFTCSTSSNIFARYNQRRFKHTIINAKYGGHTESVKQLLAQLPISSQSYSSSPYLDLSLFSYDDKWVSVMERPKACGDHPIRFYSRKSGLLMFKIHAGVLGRPIPPTTRRLVAFTFHPFYPFAISVQRNNSEYVVNFHVRHFTHDNSDHM